MEHVVSAAMLLTWQKLLLLLVLLTSCSAQGTYYIIPTLDTQCPKEPCHTLSEFIVDQHFKNLTVNTTMEFLPGNHTLEQTISMTNLTRLILHGDLSFLPEITSRIVCTWPAGFVFTDITELHINALAFISCGHSDKPALSVTFVQQSIISNCTFENNIQNICAQQATLTECLYNSPPYFFPGGGALRVSDSNCLLIENTFRDNSALYYGGALNILRSSSNLIGNTFHNNFACSSGALNVLDSTLTLTGNTFQFNSASYSGVLTALDSNLTLTGNTFQYNSASVCGGVLFASESNLTLTRNAFQYNSAINSGGALYVSESTVTFTGNIFLNTRASNGQGGVLSASGSVLTLTENMFRNNSAFASGGALCVTEHSTLNLSKNIFQNNSADSGPGGALYIIKSTLELTNNSFQNTSATLGGALYIHASTVTFTDNNFTDSSAELGGTILTAENSNVRMYGRNIIEHNRAQYGGGIAVLDCELKLAGNTIFENNMASYGGGLYAHNANIIASAAFMNNLATEGGGAAFISSSTLYFIGNTDIINNSAVDGGGLLLSGDSKLYLQPDIAVHLISNSARSTGGAIKVEESNPLSNCIPSGNFAGSISDCFFQIELHLQSSHSGVALINSINSIISTLNIPYSDITNVTLHFFDALGITLYFDNNTAAAGADLHGGSVDSCSLSIIESTIDFFSDLAILNTEILRDVYEIYTGGFLFDIIIGNDSPVYYPNGEVDYLSDFITIRNKSLNISSNPLYICTCRDNQIDCTGSYHPEPVYPGGKLEVPVIAQGQRNGTTPAIIQVINTSESNITLPQNENIQNANNRCTTLKYTIQSSEENITQNMTLYAEGPCSPTQDNTLTVTVSIIPCPPGFQLLKNQTACNCAERLLDQHFTDTCLIDNKTVLRRQGAEFWVGYDSKADGLILHPHCPLDYCTSEQVYLAANDSDKQCNYNRSGLLCGICSDNLSLALGSSRCLQCSNSYLTLLAAFGFAGIAHVSFLLVLRLTVAAGTINGLIFYANVVAVNSAIYFQPQTTNILTVFIAWLNLDLGIETCFYNGTDAYVKTWLQFAFPIYVWALVGMIIIGSHYSARVAKLFGSNPIAVLATLFLLSYAKLLRTVIAALSVTYLEYPKKQIAVWLYDGNITYFSRKHIPLFTAAMLCLIFLFLPYTTLLVFGQWLQAKSKLKIFSFINSRYIKPFLDAYHAPYSNKHRYWTGLMLLLRLLLFLISAVNVLGDPSVNLLAIGSTTTAILILPTILGTRVHKTWSLGLIETSFILNLNILTIASHYVRLTGGNQNAATFTSISIVFATFTGIVIYHSVQQVKDTPWLREILPKLALSPKTPGHTPEKRSGLEYEDSADRPVTAPTTTVIDLRELHSYELREPCLETNQ